MNRLDENRRVKPEFRKRFNHGLSETPEYSVWKNMWTRCTNPNREKYATYKDRRPPDRWRNFENFLTDMGPRPSPKHSIERVRNDLPYGPENCVWATAAEQVRNTSVTRLFTYKGETKTLMDFANELGVPYRRLRYRILIAGWSVEDAMERPLDPRCTR